MAALPEPWKSLSAAVEAMQERLRRLEQRSPFFGTGMHTNGSGGIDSDNYVAGSSGYHFGSDGNAEFNDVTIRGAVVGVDSPVLISVVKVSASNFSLSTSYVEKDGLDVTVPDGCTRVQAAMFGRLYVVNTNTTGGADGTGTEAIYVKCALGSSVTTATPTGVSGSNGFATSVGFESFVITGLTPGATLHFGVQGKCGYSSIPTFADNYILGVGTLTWLR